MRKQIIASHEHNVSIINQASPELRDKALEIANGIRHRDLARIQHDIQQIQKTGYFDPRYQFEFPKSLMGQKDLLLKNSTLLNTTESELGRRLKFMEEMVSKRPTEEGRLFLELLKKANNDPEGYLEGLLKRFPDDNHVKAAFERYNKNSNARVFYSDGSTNRAFLYAYRPEFEAMGVVFPH